MMAEKWTMLNLMFCLWFGQLLLLIQATAVPRFALDYLVSEGIVTRQSTQL